MSAPPYMKLYIGDYLGDTTHLGALEHGAYLLLLMAMWRAGGSLPTADANLAKLARCSAEEWAAIREVVLPFFKRSRSRLSHKRLGEEIAKYETISGKRSEAGKQGGAGKASKNNCGTKAKAECLLPVAEAIAPITRTTTIAIEGSEDKSSAQIVPLPEPELDLDKFAWQQAELILTTQGGLPTPRAKSVFGKLISETGLRAQDFLPALAEAQVIKTRDPIAYVRKRAAGQAKRQTQAAEPAKRVGFV